MLADDGEPAIDSATLEPERGIRSGWSRHGIRSAQLAAYHAAVRSFIRTDYRDCLGMKGPASGRFHLSSPANALAWVRRLGLCVSAEAQRNSGLQTTQRGMIVVLAGHGARVPLRRPIVGGIVYSCARWRNTP